MLDILTKLDNIAERDKINTYRFSIATEKGIETLERIAANPCQNCYSVAKVFCVTAIGMLFDEKRLSPNTTIADIFADELKQYGISQEKWKNVTVDNVLRHEIGFSEGFLDIDTEDATAYPTDDFLFIVLDRELTYDPGTVRVYSDAAYYLISRTVTKISGEKLDEFLAVRLFKKICCREVAWSRCPENYPIGATGLYLRTEDVVKLGRIYLNNGLWNEERIISKEWVDLVLERGYEFSKKGKGYAKGGMMGQCLYINYSENIAIAWHSFDPLGKTKAFFEEL
ncbi:MAG: beta-lactamase family protein [Clostridia bacterium]|nr:beta-lactamase family protein [Clostridia bacterium]